MLLDEWRVLPIDPRYELHSSGKIRRVKTKRERKLGLKQCGYLGLVFTQPNAKPRGYDFHVLMALTFLGPRPQGCDVSHIDGNRHNNSIENLCYESRAANMARNTKPPRFPKRHMSAERIALIRAEQGPLRQVAKKFNISLTHAWRIRNNRAWIELDT